MTKRSLPSVRGGFAAILALALLVTACGGGDDTDEPTDDAGSETGDTDTAADDISGTVRWTMLNYDDEAQAWVDDIIERFEEQYPDVTVDASLPATNQYQDLITTQVQGGNPPDLSAMATAWIPAFAAAGELESWDAYLDQAMLDRFDPTLLAGAEFQGELVGLPYLSTSRALYYNNAALEAVDADPPETWEDLIEVAAAISEDGTVEHGFALQGAGVEAFAAWFPYTYWASGGEFEVTDSGLEVQEDACVSAISILDELIQSGGAQPDVTSFDLPEQMGLFTSGDAAMTITGPWMVPQIPEDLDYGVAPVPAGPGGQATLGIQDAFVLWSNGENTEAAAALARFIFEEENADSLVEGRGMLPVLTEGFDAERYQDDPMATFVDMLPDAKFTPLSEEWNPLVETATNALQSVYVGDTDPQSACQTITSAGGGL